MNLYIEKFAEGIKEAVEEFKSAPSVFDIKGGNLVPHNTSQKMWNYNRGDGVIHFSDGTSTFSFKGTLDPYQQSVLHKVTDVPLPEIINNKGKNKAQVHRSDPGSMYFTLQEGKENPTYTLRHSGGDKWVAVPKARKAKKQLAQEAYIPNVNAEHVKEGMFNELELVKSALVGEALQGLANLPARLALAPARQGGPETGLGDTNALASEPVGTSLERAGVAGLAGAGVGAGYHALKRKLYNTPEENAEEDQDPNTLLRRMATPAAVAGGASFLGRRMMPGAVNNPDWTMFG